jgi:hypothetical protein
MAGPTGPRLALSVSGVLVAGALAVKLFAFPGKALDRIEWDDPAARWNGSRQAMADRLIAQRILIGKNQTDVVAMLGAPNSPARLPTWQTSGNNSFFGDPETWHYHYFLGPERRFLAGALWFEWMEVVFDETDHVSNCHTYTCSSSEF